MKDIYQVIKNVRLSEKATFLQETNNEVTLEVDRKANKIEIKQAVEELFGKTVVAVRTCELRWQATPQAPRRCRPHQ
jgi:large subunit ribosomal protein L23